jgi:hypothetical protein
MIQFNKKRGLCGNLSVMYDRETDIVLKKEMHDQFVKAGHVRLYPFGELNYRFHTHHQTHHLYSSRLAWARDHYQHPPNDQSKELTEFYGEWYKWAIDQSN